MNENLNHISIIDYSEILWLCMCVCSCECTFCFVYQFWFSIWFFLKHPKILTMEIFFFFLTKTIKPKKNSARKFKINDICRTCTTKNLAMKMFVCYKYWLIAAANNKTMIFFFGGEEERVVVVVVVLNRPVGWWKKNNNKNNKWANVLFGEEKWKKNKNNNKINK